MEMQKKKILLRNHTLSAKIRIMTRNNFSGGGHPAMHNTAAKNYVNAIISCQLIAAVENLEFSTLPFTLGK